MTHPLTPEQELEARPAVLEAVRRQVALWDAEGAIESAIGRTVDGLGEILRDAAIGADAEGNISPEAVDLILRDIEELPNA